jgi:NDP-sugar pyrophosphorylase family protein
MKAVILIGGKGTRLYPLTYTTTKSLLPVVNIKFIDRLVARLEGHGVTEIIFALNHLAEEIMRYVESRKNHLGARIVYSIEPKPLGSAGALKFNEKHLDGTFLLMNGDILTDLNYTDLVRFHYEKKSIVTVTVTQIPEPRRFGIIDTDENDRLVSWQEKPSLEEARSNWANVGIWAMEPEVLSLIPSDKFVTLENEVFQKLIKSYIPFYAYKSNIYWIDMGTPESYKLLHNDILLQKFKDPILGQQIEENIWVEENCNISDSAVVAKFVALGAGCSLDNDVIITGPSSVGSNCTIQNSTSIENSIILDNTTIGAKVLVRDSIIGKNVHIGDNISIIDTIIGDNTTVENLDLTSSKLGPDTIITK